jgi:hypothetical protein
VRSRIVGSIVSVVVASVGIVWGCNGLEGAALVESRFPAAYAQALCTSLQHCCAENSVPYNYTTCSDGWEHIITAVLASPDAGGPDSGAYSPQTAAQCVQLIVAAATVSCQPVPGSLSDARNLCNTILTGQIAQGSPCTSSPQCAPVDGSVVACAVVPGDSGTGGLPFAGEAGGGATQAVPVCTTLPMLGDGGGMPCLGPDAGIADPCLRYGLFCDPSALQCAPLNSVGGACDPSSISSCAPGGYCDQGVCTMSLAPGSACTSTAQCDSTSQCDVSGTKTCVALSAPGTQCTQGNQCTVGVCDGTTKKCLTNGIATTAACSGQN